MFSVFAVSISALATSRTCVEPPEMPSTSCETMVCAESTIASVGRVRSISPSTVARSVVDASSRFCSIALTRDARSRTCACDSSPETYSTELLGWPAAMLPAVSSSSVDLPMPGSPAISTTEPGTMPPPSTRSNSPKPVDSRDVVDVSIWVMGVAALTMDAAACVREVRPGAAVRDDDAVGRASWNSSTVPHCPHCGQRPTHLRPSQPHSLHTYRVADFTIPQTLAQSGTPTSPAKRCRCVVCA